MKLFQSGLKSLTSLFNCTEENLKEQLLSIELSNFYSSEYLYLGDYIYELIVSSFCEPNNLVSVCWFHGTRTYSDNNYEDGIFPITSDLMLLYWDIIISKAPSQEIENNLKRLKSFFDPSIYPRVVKTKESGPYAFLVREVLTHFFDDNKQDLLNMPQFLEDICEKYYMKFGSSITYYLKELFIPKIVKFKTFTNFDTKNVIGNALVYVYKRLWDDYTSGGFVHAYVGRGEAIKKEYIVTIEHTVKENKELEKNIQKFWEEY